MIFSMNRGDIDMEWSFGQVVAVSVWLLVLFSLINDCIYGPIRGRTNQLPPSLQVVRRTSLESLQTHALALDDAQSKTGSAPNLNAPIVDTAANYSAQPQTELQVLSSRVKRPSPTPFWRSDPQTSTQSSSAQRARAQQTDPVVPGNDDNFNA